MSNSGVRLNPNAPALTVNPEELIKEWRRLDNLIGELNAKIKQSNQLIEMGNKTIQECQAQGREILGQMEILARIFKGMGIDPENFEQNIEKIPPKNFPSVVPDAEKSGVIADNKEDKPEKKFKVNKYTSRPEKS